MMKGKVSVIIPTLCKSQIILDKSLDELNKNPNVQEILIFDNSLGKFKSDWSKVKVFNKENLYVNPAWNKGVVEAVSEYYLLLNDDVWLDSSVIDACVLILKKNKNVSLVTVATKEISELEKPSAPKRQTVKKNSKVTPMPEAVQFELQPNKQNMIMMQGWFLLGRKSKWKPIDKDLKYFYGDNLIYREALKDGSRLAYVTSKTIYHATSTTINALNLYRTNTLQEEGEVFKKIIGDTTIRVLVGTPSHDFTLQAMYVESLINTKELCASQGIIVNHLFVCGDALVQRARNDLFKAAYEGGFDKLVFIDSDMFWNPEDFVKLVRHDKDIIAAPCIKKNDVTIDFNISNPDKENISPDGVMKVQGVGTGFISISRNAIRRIYETSTEYYESGKDTRSKMVFNVEIVAGEMYSEDIVFCRKWRDLGGDLFVDVDMMIGHIGQKNYIGNLRDFMRYIKEQEEKEKAEQEKKKKTERKMTKKRTNKA